MITPKLIDSQISMCAEVNEAESCIQLGLLKAFSGERPRCFPRDKN